MSQKVTFEGTVYTFPDDASPDEISEALNKQTLAKENNRSLSMTAPGGGAPIPMPDSGGGTVIAEPPPGASGTAPIFPSAGPGERPPLSDLLPAAGATLGGTAGALVAGPVGAAVGAGLGGFAGEAGRRYVAGEPPSMNAALMSGGLSAATEGAGQGLFSLLGKAAAPGRAGYDAPASQAFRAAAERAGITTSPAEEIGSKGLAQVEAFPFRVPFGSSKMVEAKAEELASMERAARSFAYPGSATPAPSVRGVTEHATLSKAEDLARGQAARFYHDVSRLAGSDPIPTPQYADAIKRAVDRIEAMGGLAPASEAKFAGAGSRMLATAGPDPARVRAEKALAGQLGVDPQDPLVQNMVTQMLGPGQTGQQGISFEAADTTRQLLGSAYRSATSDFAKGRLKELRDALIADLDSWAATQGVPLQRAMQRATTFYRQEIGGVFDEKSFVRQLLNADPEQVVGMVRTVSDARTLRQAIDNIVVPSKRADALTDLRRDFMQGVVDKSLDPQTGAWSPTRFMTQISKYTPEALQAVLGRDEAARLQELTQVLGRQIEYSRAGLNPSETARGMLSAEQIQGVVKFVGGAALAGATFGAAGGTPAGLISAGAVLLTPAMVSRLLTSETGRTWLTRGLTLKLGTQEGLRAAEQIAIHGLSQRVTRDDGTVRLIMKPDAVLTGPSDLRRR